MNPKRECSVPRRRSSRGGWTRGSEEGEACERAYCRGTLADAVSRRDDAGKGRHAIFLGTRCSSRACSQTLDLPQ